MWRNLALVGFGLLVLAGPAPAAQPQPVLRGNQNQSPEIQGEIVEVSPREGLILIRVTDGTNQVQQLFRVNQNTQYRTAQNKGLMNKLAANGFQQGHDVWFRYLPNTGNAPILSELRQGPAYWRWRR